MVGTLILVQPTFVISRNSPNDCNNKLSGKYKNGFPIWLCSISKFGIMGKNQRETVRILNNSAIDRTMQAYSRNNNDKEQWNKRVLKQSLLANPAEIEDMDAMANIICCSKRQLMTVAGMVALCFTSKPSIAVEAAKEDVGNATEQSDSSTRSSDSPKQSMPKKSIFAGLINTQSWYRFRGEGFSLRVPPDFDDIMEPEDFSSGSSLYGERAKPKTYAARFASPDRSEVLSVVIRPSNQLKLSFFEAKDVSDLGSLREAASIFVPGGATLFAARTIKVKNSEFPRMYYFYEFSTQDNHIALEAAVASGKVFVVGATAPLSKWEDDGSKLRSAAISFSLI